MYKIKNIIKDSGISLQDEVKNWVESRAHVTIKSINIWYADGAHYATILYSENNYIL